MKSRSNLTPLKKIFLALSFFCLVCFALTFLPAVKAAPQALVIAGTTLNAQDYLWNRRGTSGPNPSGQVVPFRVFRFKTNAAGDYTIAMTPSGFTGAIFLYRSLFDPGIANQYQVGITDDLFNEPNYEDGVIAAAAGSVVTLNAMGLAANQVYEVVFATKNAGESGSFSATIDGPAAVSISQAPFSLLNQPLSRTALSGEAVTLRVYATGPLPQTFQWYRGATGDTSQPIAGATSAAYTFTPVTNGTYWARITPPAGVTPAFRDSSAASVIISSARSISLNGQIDTLDDTYNRVISFCQNVSTQNHYFEIVRVRILASGSYNFAVTGQDFPAAFDIYDLYFNPGVPCLNFWDSGAVAPSAGATASKTTFMSSNSPGWYDLVVTSRDGGQLGNYTVTITSPGGKPLAYLLPPYPLTIMQNPLDKAVQPGGTTTLSVAPYGGLNPRTYQWFRGLTGDTSNPVTAPIVGAAGQTFTTPALTAETKYWVRVSDAFNTVDSDTATVYVYTPPTTFNGKLTVCDETYDGGRYYKVYGFKVSTSGNYTLSVNTAGSGARIAVYDSIFLTGSPNVNLYAISGAGNPVTLTEGFLALPNTYYAVISSGGTGNHTLTINGPDLVVPQPPPVITQQPQDVNIFRGQTTTLNVATGTAGVGYQWYTGSCPNGKVAISGANSASFTTPALTDYKDYWVKLSKGPMYTLSEIAHVKIKPQVVNDAFTMDEDTSLSPTAPGIIGNDIKADSKTLTSIKVTDPGHGAFNPFNSNGTFTYNPALNYSGPDSFTYKVNDGVLDSDPGTVSIIIREINDVPVRTAGGLNNLFLAEDTPAAPLGLSTLAYGPGGGTDENTQTLTYRVTAVPAPSLGNIVLADGTTVVAANTVYSLAQIRGMQFRPAANAFGGPAAFSFTVTDNGTSRGVPAPLTLTQSLTITVAPVADTPGVSNATTIEDVRSTSGLVIARNVADGPEVLHFKITNIQGGTLYKTGGVTQINNGDFINFAEGNAGLKFSPSANLYSPSSTFSFDVRASLNTLDAGLGGGTVTATIIVNPVNDPPAFTRGANQTLGVNAGAQTVANWATGISAGPSEAGQNLMFLVSNNNNSLFSTQPAISPAGTLSYTPAGNTSGSATVTVQLRDDGGTANGGQDSSAVQSFTITVNKYNTAVAITNDTPDPSVAGQAYAVTAGVAVPAPGVGTPTGTITISDGSRTCTITLPGTSCNLTSTTAGAKTLSATYNGDANFNNSESAGFAHQVNRAATTTTITADTPDPSFYGQNYAVTAGVAVNNPGGGTPTGTITVTDGTNNCTITLPATNCNLPGTSVGAKTLTATYNGDANFNNSVSEARAHQVNRAATTTTITAATPNPSVFGQNYAVTAGVTVNSPGSGTPTGTVTVTDGMNNCTITLPATNCNLPGTSVGARTLTATYNGDINFNASPASAGASHTVNKADATTTIVSDNPDSSAAGQNVTVVYTVVAAAPGAGTPTGSVTVSDGLNSCTGTVAAGSCVVALTAPGNRTLTATYAGDANFNGGSDSNSHTVVAPPSIAKAFTPATAPINTTTTLIFTITNPSANTVALTGVGFTDPFPAGLIVATPLTTTNTCGGVLTNDAGGVLAAGASGIKLSGGTVNASGPCTVSVKVTPISAGPFNNVTGNVNSTNGGQGNAATATLATSAPPAVSSNALTIKAGSNAAGFTIATAMDADQAASTLGFTINGDPATASSNGVTISNVSLNANGGVTANIAATCAAASAAFNLAVTDNQGATGTGTLTVTVTPNTPPVLTYNPQTVTAGTMVTINPAAAPSDNGTLASLLLQGISPNNGGLAVVVNAATGQVRITGATLIGNYTVTVAATDNCNDTTVATLMINVVCPAISLNPASLPGGAAGTAYNQTVSATPAGTAYSFAVSSGALPAGLTLNSNGSFSGAPTQSGTFNFGVTATGFGACSGFRDYVLTVECPGVTLAPASLPGGTVGTAYSQTVSASPAALAGSYRYSVTNGALPAGLTLDAETGAVAGTPTQPGAFSFSLMAAAGACAATHSYSVTIGCSTITLAAPGTATVGTSYASSVAASPNGAYTYSLVTGSLPAGLTLNAATGALTGTPSSAGTYNFTLKALAADGCSGQQSYTLEVVCPAVTLTALPAPALNAAYSQTVTATPAGGGYTYAVSGGALPAGLALNATTGQVSGMPSVAGAYSFTLTAMGFGVCTGSRTYTGTIAGGDCPTITLPDLPGGAPGQLYTSSVTATPSGSYNYAVTSGSLPPGLTLFGSMGLLYGYPTTAGTYNFTVTATDSNNCTSSKNYAVNIGGAAVASLVFGDFDGDGRADLSVWRGQSGDWLTINSKDGKLKTEAWGTIAAPYFDVMAPGDYDGDGRMDLAVFRKSTGQWLIKGSKDNAVTVKVWGLGTDIPVPGDYDGDGKTDIAVWRGAESNWYILLSGRGSDQQTLTISWGTSNAPCHDLPVPADYDGDGKTDIAVFRQQNGHWYIRLSSDGSTLDQAWGLGSDVPVAADYDGDGKADIAVWRGSETNWYILRSSDGAVQSISWGASSLGDLPVPGDFDGDGKGDVAVWRVSDGNWYIKVSRDEKVITQSHGLPGDVPVMLKAKP